MLSQHRQGRRRPLRSILSWGVGLGAMMATAGTVAVAQEAGDQADEDVRRLNTIEVSATRREGVTVQDVPVAVTAFDAELVRQTDITDLTNIAQLSPSVLAGQGQSASAGTSISIRGLGTPSDDFGFEPAVGIFIDGVFRTRTGVAAQELPELAGVEVLRGPQGTLFGRSTSAGVVSFNTAKPEFEPRVTARVGYGNFNEVEVEFTATGETLENQASRLDFKFRRRDGFIEDLNSDEEFNNLDRFFVRFQHIWEGENTSARFIADFTQTDEDCCGAVQTGEFVTSEGTTVGGTFDPILGFLTSVVGPTTGTLAPGLVPVTANGTLSSDDRFIGAFTPTRPFVDDVTDWGVSLEINHDFGWANFTSISAYRDFDSIRDQDIDFSAVDLAFRDDQTNDDRNFTQEFRLQGTAFNDRLDWLVGSFYLFQDIDTTDTVQVGTQVNEFLDATALFSTTGAAVGAVLTGETPGPVGQLFDSIPAPLADGLVLSIIEGAFEGEGLPPTGVPALGIPSVTDVFGLIGPVGLLAPFALPPSAEGDGNDPDSFDLDTNSIAFFTHNNISITDRLTLTGGLRYSYEKKNFDVNLITTGQPVCDVFLDPATEAIATGLGGLALLACNAAVNPEFDGVRGDARIESEFTGTIKASYELTPDILLYVGYSRGFKPGSFNLTRGAFESSIDFGLPGVPVGEPGVDPLSELEFEEEEVNAVEGGFKSSWFDGRLTLNAVAFFQDVNNFQENVFNGANFVTIGTDVESLGVEVDFAANPIEGLLIQGGFAYNSVERQEEVPAGPTDVLLADTQLGGTPEFVVTGQGTYTREIFPGIEGVAHLNFRWNSEFDTSSLASVAIVGAQEAFATVGARVSLQDVNQRWRVSALVENAFDQDFQVATFPATLQPGNFAVFPGAPRFFGGEISVTF